MRYIAPCYVQSIFADWWSSCDKKWLTPNDQMVWDGYEDIMLMVWIIWLSIKRRQCRTKKKTVTKSVTTVMTPGPGRRSPCCPWGQTPSSRDTQAGGAGSSRRPWRRSCSWWRCCPPPWSPGDPRHHQVWPAQWSGLCPSAAGAVQPHSGSGMGCECSSDSGTFTG